MKKRSIYGLIIAIAVVGTLMFLMFATDFMFGLNFFNNKYYGNDLIKVSFPLENSKIESPLTVKGEARGNWYFEASFPVIVVNWDGLIIAEGYAQAKDNWMTNDFVSFETTIEFENPVFPGADENHFSRRGAIILQKDNPSGLPEYDDAIEIPVWFK